MPALAALTINDGLGTPANHTFSPVKNNGTKVTWADRSPTIPAGYRLISFELAEPSGARTVWKLTLGFNFPVVATVDGVDTVVRYNSGQIVLNVHPDSTLQDRKDQLAYMANCLDEPDVKTAIENLEPFF